MVVNYARVDRVVYIDWALRLTSHDRWLAGHRGIGINASLRANQGRGWDGTIDIQASKSTSPDAALTAARGELLEGR